MTDTDPTTAERLFLFSALTIYFALACPRKGDGALLVGESGYPDWLFLLQGTRAFTRILGPGVDGPVAPLFNHGADRWLARDPNPEPVSRVHEHLDSMRSLIALRQHDVDLRNIYFKAIDELAKSFSVFDKAGGGQCDLTDAFVWIFEVAEDFLPLLREPTQEAVAIMAFFAVLLKRLEKQWWLRGWADHLIAKSYNLLDDEHRLWVQWPLQETGYSDGPLPLAAAMDTYRVNRYNVTGPGTMSNRLIQGAFRYQRLNLSSPGVLTLRNVGAHPTLHTTPATDLPGYFESSDDTLNQIWAVGARKIQMTEVPKNNLPDFLEVTADGALAESVAPQVLGSAVAAQLLQYDLTFQVKPLVGGFAFTVLSDTQNSGIYISCDIVNGKIAAYAGSTQENEQLQSFDLPSNLTIAMESWHTVRVTVAITDIKVTIDGWDALTMSQTARVFGSFGIGASFGHRAVFRNLSAYSPDGTKIYSHPLTDTSFLPHFFMGTNPAAAMVDGSRRDRIAYTGDLDIAGGAALVSTHGLEYIMGTSDLFGSYQATPGFFIPTAKIQQAPLEQKLDVNITGLIGYSFNLLTAVASTYMHTGNVTFAQFWAPKIQAMLDWADSQTLDNGLFNLSNASFGGDWNYYDPTQSGVVTKFNVIYAYALQECLTILADGGIDNAVYQERLARLRNAIDTQLWSDELENMTTGFSQDSNAIAILAGVNLAANHSSQAILSTLSAELMRPAGPLAFSSDVIASGFQPYISPFASAYHLRAALASNNSDAAVELLNKLWTPMADSTNANYTGCFWETLDQDGHPGLGTTTSLCHGWAAGPSAELTQYVLGATPAKPGWAEFQVAPLTLGLRSARGKIPLVDGMVEVEWAFDSNGLLTMTVDAPMGTTGTVNLPNPMLIPARESRLTVNGFVQESESFEVVGGTALTLVQTIAS
ncbi:hypothetical protein N8I77_009779 [Diaporthe amygdali]|uniref:Alpha-L-rhamnosidase n=1 Tax=Phomopsis amygdali TaxID=1214568 RepID=A0AAD9SAW1_PHOAM|nr:hypothetical protein N8I77_009779 [Diaporthe amygdali]